MMNECNYYPKKLFIHGYDYNTLHWEWNDDSVTQLLTQFFSRLESISVDFSSVEKEIRNYSHDSKYSNIGDFKKGFELVLNCCFSSPVLHSLVITTPIRDNRAEFFSALSRKLGPSLKIINFTCQKYVACYVEAFTNIIASHGQLTDVYLYFNIDQKVAASSLSYLYTSLIDFVQRPELFSKFYLNGQLPLSSYLRLLLNAFLKTPCSQPQEIHLYPRELACSELLPVDLRVGDNKVPSGALIYKYLIFHEHSEVPVDFCEWLFSHQHLVLKAFHFDTELMKIGERNILVQTSFPMQFLSDNTLFQTQELLLPIFPYHILQNLLQHQKLTKLLLKQPFHSQRAQESKPCDISAIIGILSLQVETLTELTIPSSYHKSYVSVESSADMECFGNALFSLKYFCFASQSFGKKRIILVAAFTVCTKPGKSELKSFQMGKFE